MEQAIHAIEQALTGFRNSSFGLGQLVNKLDALIENIPPGDLQDSLRSDWWTLEQVFAISQDGLQSEPRQTESLVNEAIERITATILSFDR
jgi:hypothetical protein